MGQPSSTVYQMCDLGRALALCLSSLTCIMELITVPAAGDVARLSKLLP